MLARPEHRPGRFSIGAGVTIADAMAGCLRFLRERSHQVVRSLSGVADVAADHGAQNYGEVFARRQSGLRQSPGSLFNLARH